MGKRTQQIKGSVAAGLTAAAFCLPQAALGQQDGAGADTGSDAGSGAVSDMASRADADTNPARTEAELLAALREAEPAEARRITNALGNLWGASGSEAMDFLLKRGRDAIEVRDWPGAVVHLTALTDHAPGFAEGYYHRALAYFRLERFGPAMADLERVLALNPNHFGALRGVGAILEMLDEPDRALAAYEMVLKLNPNDTEAQEGAARMRLASEGQAL
jgi:tetratricopeptide (TPR) repeat protein